MRTNPLVLALGVVLLTMFGALYVIPVAAELYGGICHPWRQPIEAHLAIETREFNDRINVSGTSDLPDGAVVGYYFLLEAELRDLATIGHQAGGETVVRDGAFNFTADLSEWPAGSVIVGVDFATGVDYSQPANVIDTFGSRGECLAGPQVSVDSPGDLKTLFVEEVVER